MQSYLTDRAQEEVLQEEILNLLSEIQALEKKLTETTEEIKGKKRKLIF